MLKNEAAHSRPQLAVKQCPADVRTDQQSGSSSSTEVSSSVPRTMKINSDPTRPLLGTHPKVVFGYQRFGGHLEVLHWGNE